MSSFFHVCPPKLLVVLAVCEAGSVPPLPRFGRGALRARVLKKKARRQAAAKNPKGARLEPADLREQMALEEAKGFRFDALF